MAMPKFECPTVFSSLESQSPNEQVENLHFPRLTHPLSPSPEYYFVLKVSFSLDKIHH